MQHGITICIVGAGSSYTPELIDGLLRFAPEELPVTDIRMHDLAPERLAVMAGLAERMIAQSGRKVTLRHGHDLAALLDGVDFVVTQVRVGGMAARALDEKIPLKYDIIGQETTGPGGMFKALRTIPPMLEVARTVERVAPNAFILNYTNPSGIITEAVSRHTNARIIGLCSGIPGLQARIRELLADTFGPVRSYSVGLNHLGFVYKFFAGKRDITVEALEQLLRISAEKEDHAGLNPPAVMRALGAVSLGYIGYYLDRRQVLANAKARATTRAEDIMEIERRIFEEAQNPNTVSKPEALIQRGGGGYADVTFQCMQAIAFDRGDELACTVRNGDAVTGIEPDAGVEIVCTIDRAGPHPISVGPIPLAFRGLVQAVKAYETLTIEAAMQRSKSLAVQALINHPLVGDLPTAEAIVEEMLAAHGMAYT